MASSKENIRRGKQERSFSYITIGYKKNLYCDKVYKNAKRLEGQYVKIIEIQQQQNYQKNKEIGLPPSPFSQKKVKI